jgi:NTP pyrophosphatase (non-canonical NTP hydrolase)
MVEFIRSISWLLALANNLEVDIESAVLGRYPSVCPYCLSQRCICAKTGKKPQRKIPAYKISEELFYLAQPQLRDQYSLHALANMVSEIYPNNLTTWDAIGAWKHTSKFSEELAEIHEAFSKYFAKTKPHAAVAEEFADLFAWVLTAWQISLPGVEIDEAFISYYENGCPVCARHRNCACAKFSDLSSNLVDPIAIGKLSDAFIALVKELEIADDDVSEIEKSLKAAAESQSEPIARTAVEQAKTKVAEIEKVLESGAKNTKNAGTILSSFYKVLESIGFI